jgi:hypothetical protein
MMKKKIQSTESNLRSTGSNLRSTGSNLRSTESNLRSTESNLRSTESNFRKNSIKSDIITTSKTIVQKSKKDDMKGNKDGNARSATQQEKCTKIQEECTDIKEYKKNLKYPISDDTLDYLETESDKLSESKNLSEKIRLHTELKCNIQSIGNEVDAMVELIDKIDSDLVTKEISHENNTSDLTDDTDIADDTVNLEKGLADLVEEDVLQVKIKHLQRLTEMVKKCRVKCGPAAMKIAKCSS